MFAMPMCFLNYRARAGNKCLYFGPLSLNCKVKGVDFNTCLDLGLAGPLLIANCKPIESERRG